MRITHHRMNNNNKVTFSNNLPKKAKKKLWHYNPMAPSYSLVGWLVSWWIQCLYVCVCGLLVVWRHRTMTSLNTYIHMHLQFWLLEKKNA